MCYVSSTIAGYFIGKSTDEGSPLSALQLIKLVYIAHGWNLALNDKPLVSDRVEAWKYGPVMPSLHSLFKGQGYCKNDLVLDFLIEEVNCVKPLHRVLLNKVFAKYKHFSGEELTALMHEEDTPWYTIWDNGNGKDHQITDDLTYNYYIKQINQDSYNSLPEYPSIETREDAILFLKKSGIFTENGELNSIYRNT